jgi:isoleucyl-tRNA synthetase
MHMPFQEVPNKVDFPAQERLTLQQWREQRLFEQLVQLHANDPRWSFIDGPITANNPMGAHHGWGRTYKDLFQRFWTMRGHKLRYQNGFDCQGLWVEVEVEKELGFRSKKDIEDFGLEAFVRQCKARVLRFAAVQTEQSLRLGYWMDWNDPDHLRWLAERLLEDPAQQITVPGVNGPVTDTVEQIVGRLGLAELGGSYFTFSNENNFMIWTFLKKCWQKGWLYRGADVMPWCPRCATAISQHEIVTDGYAELTHPAVTLRFPLVQLSGEPATPGSGAFPGNQRRDAQTGLPEALLVWTTTPWTLTSNVAAAVGPALQYTKVRQGDEVFYLSTGTLHMLRGDYQVLGELSGLEMAGWLYSGPFDDLPAAQKPGGLIPLPELAQGITVSAQQAHRVILWEAVGEAEGTGIVHIAPGCGAEDFQLGRENHLPLLAPLDDEGYFVDGFGWLSGRQVAQVATPIFADLQRKGLLYQVEDYTHRYPTCWRCKTELVFRLVDEWFISMGEKYNRPRAELTSAEKQRSLRYQIMDVVDQIRWIPAFGFDREMDWLNNMHDWMISKKRYWGLALPIWTCAACGHFEVIGDENELKQRAVSGWEDFAGHTPHRPFIDAVKLACPQCGGTLNRIPDVGNPWLDAGVVPFSTLRYRTDQDYWRQWYPAHWISESFPGQFRNWFYSLLAMATVLDSTPPFLENFSYATLLAEDGRAMHKSAGNMIEFNEAADQMGVDVMRWQYCAHKPENDLLFGYQRGDEVRRRVLIPLWNAYSFFVTYARLDGWSPPALALSPEAGNRMVATPACPEGTTPSSDNLLDRWVLARLNQVITAVTRALEQSDPLGATGELEIFLDDLTNWYIRRSRRRFWKSEHDADKNAAYATLYHCLLKLLRTMAPFTPFITESMYQNLVRGVQPNAYSSVHLTAWPTVDFTFVQVAGLEGMNLARQVCSLGLAARNAAGIKVRQPLSKALAFASQDAALNDELAAIVMDELNVKSFEWVPDPRQLVIYKVLPDNKLLGPRFGKRFPAVRAALASVDPAWVAQLVQERLPVKLEVEGETVELDPQEVLVQTLPAAGLAVAADRQVTVAIDAAITPELREEGLAREIVRRVQALRKEAGFNIEDRITTYYQASDEIIQVMVNWQGYLCAETLSRAFINQHTPSGAFVQKLALDGKELVIGVVRE